METNIFTLHSDSIIGYKRLSNADLGLSSGNQTHIGLFENTLSFLPRQSSVSTGQLIYQRSSTELICLLDYIENPDGSIRSPKIRKGHDYELSISGQPINSIVREVRSIASQNREQIWYLLWFGLDNDDLVFFLFNNNSAEFRAINNILRLEQRGRITRGDRVYSLLLQYLNKLVFDSSIDYLEELEIIAQTHEETNITKRIKPRRIDIEKANQFFKETGRNGEELVFRYLEEQKRLNLISDFNWVNQSKESGYPYDFEITHLDNQLFFTDVKSTVYTFQQKMIFSSGELAFINENPNYQVHRVFELREEPKLRICNNINQIVPLFLPHYINFKNNIEENELSLKGMKIGVSPTHGSLKFDESIRLNQIVQ